MDFLSALSAGLGALNTGYNIYTNKRDYDYQRSLQQQIFDREDTAVQRRVEDLKAAGMNPSLAAGSAAQAGSVVSRSSTNDVNFGSFLDNLSAANQIKLQRQQTENAKIENNILRMQQTQNANNTVLSNINTALQTGRALQVSPIIKEDGSLDWRTQWDINPIMINQMPLYDLFKNDYKYQKNQADYAENTNEYLRRQLNWFAADKIMDYAGTLGGFALPKMTYKLNK